MVSCTLAMENVQLPLYITDNRDERYLAVTYIILIMFYQLFKWDQMCIPLDTLKCEMFIFLSKLE